MLHDDDHALFQRAKELCNKLAAIIGEDCIVEPKRRPNGADGLCYTAETPKRIAILVRSKDYAYDGGAWASRPSSWGYISKVCAHEVAHLKHSNHGSQFKELEEKLIELI